MDRPRQYKFERGRELEEIVGVVRGHAADWRRAHFPRRSPGCESILMLALGDRLPFAPDEWNLELRSERAKKRRAKKDTPQLGGRPGRAP